MVAKQGLFDGRQALISIGGDVRWANMGAQAISNRLDNLAHRDDSLSRSRNETVQLWGLGALAVAVRLHFLLEQSCGLENGDAELPDEVGASPDLLKAIVLLHAESRNLE